MYIQANRYPNCRTIAEEFCISQRQASRDIEYLRYSLNAPVEYSPEHNGYYYTDEAYHLPSIMISHQEKEMLSYLADQYKLQGSEMAHQLADLFNRLGGDNSAVSGKQKITLPVYNMNRKEFYCIRSIEDAIRKKKKIKIHYINSGNVFSTRVVHPYILFTQTSRNYLAAYCEMRKEERVFRVTRIKKARVLEKTFTMPRGFNPDNYGEQYVFYYKLPYHADVEFDSPVDAGTFTLPVQKKEGSGYRIFFRRSQELISQLVGSGVAFQILTPGWVKEKLHRYFTRIIDKNR
jgi:predicted DNA-binding transcriptional regulator YafY